MTDSLAADAHAASSVTAEEEILRLAREEPELGQVAVAERLRQAGLRISPSGVRYLWQKHGLEPAVKRLQALVEHRGTRPAARQKAIRSRWNGAA